MGELAAITGDFLCPACGYNLRGLTQDRCPECGAAFDRATLTDSQLPWAHRRHRGRLRSYWRTVWQVTFHPKKLAAEFCRPVNYLDAQRFRWFTIFWAWLPLITSTLLPDLSGRSKYLLLGNTRLHSDVWLMMSLHLAIILALVTLTGVPSYFFHPRRLPVEYQNRGIALSYYACAPLAWAPVIYLASRLIALASPPGMAGLYTTFVLASVQFAMWWYCLSRLGHRILRQEGNASILAYFTVPLTAILASAGVCFLIGQLVLYFGLLCFSLRQ